MTERAVETWGECERCLALFAHCDDVEMRVGGTLARLVREGRRVVYTVVVENAFVGPHVSPRPPARRVLELRRAESGKAAHILGVARTEFLGFKSYYLSREDGTVVYPSMSSPETVQEELRDVVFDGLPPILNAYTIPACRDRLVSLIREERPQLILTQSPDDRHPDHYGVARVVTLLVEDLVREGLPLHLWYAEPGTGGPMAEFWPDTYVELSDADVARRQDAMACYPSQFPNDMRDYGRQRCQAYGRLAGVPFAEAFRAGIWPRMTQGDGDIFKRLAAGPPPPSVIRLRDAMTANTGRRA